MSDKFAMRPESFEWLCARCRHKYPGYPARCAAYPKGIPLEILDKRIDHVRPYLNDGGIVFEPDPDTPAQWSPDLTSMPPRTTD